MASIAYWHSIDEAKQYISHMERENSFKFIIRTSTHGFANGGIYG